MILLPGEAFARAESDIEVLLAVGASGEEEYGERFAEAEKHWRARW